MMIVFKNKYKIDLITNNLSSNRQTVRPDLSKSEEESGSCVHIEDHIGRKKLV